MKHFVIKNPWDWERIPKDLHLIQSDPTIKYEVWIYTKKKDVTFEEVLNILLKTLNKNEYLGAISLVYFKYYNEFYNFLLEAAQDPIKFKKHARAINKFRKKALYRWIEFIKYSDDTMYPQNNVFREMNDLLTKILVT